MDMITGYDLIQFSFNVSIVFMLILTMRAAMASSTEPSCISAIFLSLLQVKTTIFSVLFEIMTLYDHYICILSSAR